MPDDGGRRAWVTRVLAIDFRASASPKPGASTREIWREAADAVGSQLSALAAALNMTGIPQLTKLASNVEYLLEDVSPRLMGALGAWERHPTDVQMRAAALAAVAALSDWVSSDPRVLAVDGNLFGVTVTARATLGAALRQIQHRLSARAEAAA